MKTVVVSGNKAALQSTGGYWSAVTIDMGLGRVVTAGVGKIEHRISRERKREGLRWRTSGDGINYCGSARRWIVGETLADIPTPGRRMSMYCYIWSYVVRPECLPAFRTAYGPDGDWVRLFQRDPEYIRTNFLGDLENPTRFMTIDFWTSREACLSFRPALAALVDGNDFCSSPRELLDR